MQGSSLIPRNYPALLWTVLFLSGLYLTSLYSYLLFHSLVEMFSIVVAGGIFALAWNSRRFVENSFFVFIGIAYLFVGGLDLVHTLAYKGMGIFPGYGANLPTQLWIGTRYVNSVSLLVAPLLIGRRIYYPSIFSLYSLAAFFLLGSIYTWGIFPDCFLEGEGLTPFKKVSEYLISLILIVAILLLLKRRREFDGGVLRLLVLSIVLTIGSELAFTFYIGVYDLSNLIGHYLKLIAFYLIYKAIIETGLVKPYNLLFRNLKQNEEALRRAHDDLEIRVQQRTAELTRVNEALQVEIMERQRAEEALQESEKSLRRLSSQLLEAQENERKWIARELHDSVGQILAAIKFSLERKISQLGQKKLLGDVLGMLQNCIEETRRIMTNLRPSTLDDLGILATLNWFCREFQKVYSHVGIQKQIDIQESEIPERLKVVIFRILQEAMNNSVKHSQGDHISFALEKKNGVIEFMIRDNGLGFDVQNSPKGLGLNSMKERTELSGGSFAIESSRGTGTIIRASWPLSEG